MQDVRISATLNEDESYSAKEEKAYQKAALLPWWNK